MATTETPPPAPEAEAEAVIETTPAPPETVEEVPPPTKAEEVPPADSPPIDYFGVAEVVLRFLLFASALVSVVVIVTSKQTKPSGAAAKFNYSPALIYFVAALSVAGLYGIITTLLSFYALLKPASFPQVVSHFLIIDVVLLGIVGAATGSAGDIAYTGWKGNSHLGWAQICGAFDKFCRYAAASVAVSLFASLVLASLILLSFYSLSKKIPK